MNPLNIWESEYRFMLIVWDSAPIASGELVSVCKEQLGWKKSTTYNAIRKMCEKGLIRNHNAIVEVIIPKEEVQAQESNEFIDKTFGGSLPSFLAAFLNKKRLSPEEAQQIKRLIDEYEE